ncbi:MAG: 2-oxoglutarate dehydrogenase E2 component (dihydrolipoamide succinyltransferase) [Enterobacterales bacterium]|jgi:2-oxoglutarate dehydrogenase E2 component (dihydrolipoamide succinyltransferase)
MPKLIDIKLPADELEGTEATISQWLIKEGQLIQKGEPLVELETDKVSMEICAPETGILKQILVNAGEKVEPELLLGTLTDQTNLDYSPAIAEEETATITNNTNNTNESENTANISSKEQLNNEQTKNGKTLLSPAVRRLLKENELTIEQISGSGRDGRVTRNDVVNYMESNVQIHSKVTPFSQTPLLQSIPVSRPSPSTLVPHTNMRKSIANHMVSSLLETSPHVTSVFEMDMSNLIEHRKWHKKEYADLGVKLTFTAYFLAAMAKAVKVVPQVNAKFHDDALEMFSDVNIGVGTALGDSGLVVPVVQQVQLMNLFEIANSLNQQTEKARDNKLKPSDMKNGTLTISNHGVSGSLFATPIIINQPQVAILGVGKLEKRVVVIEINGEDVIEIKPKCYVSLSIDHRALDAHQTNLYLSEFVNIIENWGM